MTGFLLITSKLRATGGWGCHAFGLGCPTHPPHTRICQHIPRAETTDEATDPQAVSSKEEIRLSKVHALSRDSSLCFSLGTSRTLPSCLPEYLLPTPEFKCNSPRFHLQRDPPPSPRPKAFALDDRDSRVTAL